MTSYDVICVDMRLTARNKNINLRLAKVRGMTGKRWGGSMSFTESLSSALHALGVACHRAEAVQPIVNGLDRQ